MTTEEVKEIIGDLGSLVNYDFEEFVTNKKVIDTMKAIRKFGDDNWESLEREFEEKFPQHLKAINELFIDGDFDAYYRNTVMASCCSFDLKNYSPEYNEEILSDATTSFHDAYNLMDNAKFTNLLRVYKNKQKFTSADFKRHLEQGYNGELSMFDDGVSVKALMSTRNDTTLVITNSFKTTLSHGVNIDGTSCNTITKTSRNYGCANATMYHIVTNAKMYDVRQGVDNRRYKARLIQPNTQLNMLWDSYNHRVAQRNFDFNYEELDRDDFDNFPGQYGYVNSYSGSMCVYLKDDAEYDEDMYINIGKFYGKLDNIVGGN